MPKISNFLTQPLEYYCRVRVEEMRPNPRRLSGWFLNLVKPLLPEKNQRTGADIPTYVFLTTILNNNKNKKEKQRIPKTQSFLGFLLKAVDRFSF
jgi:hypothetical protein